MWTIIFTLVEVHTDARNQAYIERSEYRINGLDSSEYAEHYLSGLREQWGKLLTQPVVVKEALLTP